MKEGEGGEEESNEGKNRGGTRKDNVTGGRRSRKEESHPSASAVSSS